MARKLQDQKETAKVGRRLHAARTRAGLSLMELADRLDVTYQQIGKYERGENYITIVALKQLAKAIGVEPCEICGCCHSK